MPSTLCSRHPLSVRFCRDVGHGQAVALGEGDRSSPAKAIQASPPHTSPPLREPFQGSYSLLFHNAFKRTACRRTVWSAALSSIGATPFFCEWFTVVPRVSSTGWLAVCSAFFCACANLS